MNKIICIVGSTGTGKTKKAIELSKLQPSILVSADSRQVYRGMDIVTGKDHLPDTTIYGIDIVDPDIACSVAVWFDNVMPFIEQAWKDNLQVIIVGGTGLYVKALTDGIPTMQVPINQNLRDELCPLSVVELQNKLLVCDQDKYLSMNHSDQLNSRRLIRAIEIAMSSIISKPSLSKVEYSLIGLKYSDEKIQKTKITQRVLSRIEQGAIAETKTLLSKYGEELPSMSAIGYESIIRFIKGKISNEEMVDNWVNGEKSYVKRQMTWFRKQPVIWYDVNREKE